MTPLSLSAQTYVPHISCSVLLFSTDTRAFLPRPLSARVVQVCEAQLQFAPRTPLPVFGGTYGPEVKKSIVDIQESFQGLVRGLKSLTYDILDVKATRYDNGRKGQGCRMCCTQRMSWPATRRLRSYSRAKFVTFQVGCLRRRARVWRPASTVARSSRQVQQAYGEPLVLSCATVFEFRNPFAT